MGYQQQKDLCFKVRGGPEGHKTKIVGGLSQQILEKPTAVVIALSK